MKLCSGIYCGLAHSHDIEECGDKFFHLVCETCAELSRHVQLPANPPDLDEEEYRFYNSYYPSSLILRGDGAMKLMCIECGALVFLTKLD